jgi:hypothetical protein
MNKMIANSVRAELNSECSFSTERPTLFDFRSIITHFRVLLVLLFSMMFSFIFFISITHSIHDEYYNFL